jgi:hypothetical protein
MKVRLLQKGGTSCLLPLISQKETEQPVPGLNRLASFMPEKALARR